MSPRNEDQATALALAAGRGDPAALEQFIKATHGDVWRLMAYLAGSGVADDLTQETFLRAIGSLPRFTGRSSARTWLLSIARRVVVDQIRHHQSRPRINYAVDVHNVIDKHRPTGRFEDIVEIKMLLDTLEPERKHALLLTQVFGMSYAEAAEVCGCPVGTIRSRVARARDDLLNATRTHHRAG
ncbi:RNA polymerase sigma factor SigC [Mycolicibacterium elephantis]